MMLRSVSLSIGALTFHFKFEMAIPENWTRSTSGVCQPAGAAEAVRQNEIAGRRASPQNSAQKSRPFGHIIGHPSHNHLQIAAAQTNFSRS
jgi:hypothetical protein